MEHHDHRAVGRARASIARTRTTLLGTADKGRLIVPALFVKQTTEIEYYWMTTSGPLALGTADKNVVRSTLWSQFGPTHLVVSLDPTPNFSGSAETDIVYEEETIPGSADGINWCNDELSG